MPRGTSLRLHPPQFLHSVCRPGNREKLRYSQAQPGPAIKSAVAYFASIYGVANGMQELCMDRFGEGWRVIRHKVLGPK